MRKFVNLILLAAVLALSLNGCGTGPSPTTTAATFATETPLPTSTTIPPTPTAAPKPKGKTIVVTNAEDSGSGTLRQVLQEAQPGDIITFDPIVFPPQKPTSIAVESLLPELSQGYLTIDASNAGVILDGSNIKLDWSPAFQITSTGNTIQGVQIINFVPGTGFGIADGAQQNMIGGDPRVGSGPTGQGNLVGNSSNGVSVGGMQTAFNTISGNYFGIDPGGKALPLNAGIHLEDGANHNMIGPGNTISNCSDEGIGILDENTIDNTITKNSIFDNSGDGIRTSNIGSRPGGNLGLAAPTITDFDLQTGSIQGTTCPGCNVELFSDQSDEGKISEGSSVADQSGAFSFMNGNPFTGPRLTTTTTDGEGNSSGFSVPTWGLIKYPDLQAENRLSKRMLDTKSSDELTDNHIGGDLIWEWVRGQDNADVYQRLIGNIRLSGIQWLRTGFWSPSPLTWQEVLKGPGQYIIPQDVDDFITQLANDKINIVLTLSAGAGLENGSYGTNGWGAIGQREPEGWFNSQSERDQFSDFTRFMVQHFRGRIRYYEIWNEPNCGENPGDPRGGLALDDYILLVNQVAPIIHEVDPQAKVVAGAVGRFYKGDQQWLIKLLGSGTASQIDAISWHPFYGESPILYSGTYRTEPEPYYWRDYFNNVQDFERKAANLGFKGDYMVEEMIWRSPSEYNENESLNYPEVVAAKYAARANISHLALDFTMVSNQLGALYDIQRLPRYAVIRNLSTILAAAKPATSSVIISSKVTNIKSYGFSLPNGDDLVAIWDDGLAAEDYPGSSSTVTIPGFAGWKATGVDALNGFEQELVSTSEDSNLVISDFLLKDYPIVIRLSK